MDHQQANIYKKKLKNAGEYGTKTSILWDPIYIHKKSLQLSPAFR